MRYMLLSPADQDTLLEQLSAMPVFLDEAFGGLSDTDARVAGADGFTPVEQCWHLADLEREGYAVRIRRLLTEVEPALPDFDGERVAQERNGSQEGVGRVGLCDIPLMMAEHDAAHRAEIEEWKAGPPYMNR